MRILDMVDPIWNISILHNTVRELQRLQVNELQWELAAVKARMLREIRRLKRALLLLVDGWLKLQKQYTCIPDEHYVQTLLVMHDFEGELESRTITYTEWNESVTNIEKKPSDAVSGPISPMDARRSRDDSDPNDIR
ncbi:hypothetical protein CQW23_03541 [Capsicum baccatum]|uniref:Uncharacterized protein n=1 Tax=Capsicum baccatum TaxID=33114 RepID=A0A2G2XC47_CAPBA|nr:hypothetical protein CQW23_03541 [Capsicum baccatum]